MTFMEQGVIDETMCQTTLKPDGGKLMICEINESWYDDSLETVTEVGLAYVHCCFKGTLIDNKASYSLDSVTTGFPSSYNSVKKFLQNLSDIRLVENS